MDFDEYRKFVASLGYLVDKVVWVEWFSTCDGVSKVSPQKVHVMARWDNGRYSVHFDVPNTVFGFFEAFDEMGDPQLVNRCWITASDDLVVSTSDLIDSEPSVDWKRTCCPHPENN